MLAQAGVLDEQQLKKIGSIAAYQAVLASGQRPSINLLWAIEGAITDRHWQAVARDERTRLLMALEKPSS